MDIFVFSDSRRAEGYFRISRRSERFSLPRFLPLQDLKAAVLARERGSFIYLDLNGLADKEMAAHLRLLARNDHVYYGLLDPSGKIKDVAALFQQGASDYAGKSVLQEGITARRMNRVFRYLQEHPQTMRLRGEEDITAQETWAESDLNWENIVTGQLQANY